jgi:magnesium transporter
VGSHQVPRDPLSNSGLTEELDVPIGTAAAYAVRNVPVARPEERVAAVLDGMRGFTFNSGIVVAVCTNGRLVGLAPIELLLAAPTDAVVADVMDIDAPVVAPGTHRERAAWWRRRAEPKSRW